MPFLIPSPRLPRRQLMGFMSVFAVVGLSVVALTLAAGTFVAFEAEQATLANGAFSVTVAGASGGQAIQLSAATPAPTATPTPTPTPKAISKKLSAYYVFWDKANGFASIQQNYDLYDSVSPFAYNPDEQGNVIFDPNGGGDVVDDVSLAYFRSKNIRIIPALHNLRNGTWNDADLVTNIIQDPTLRQAHITKIVNLVQSKNYDGIDIDYENLKAADRSAFTAFMTGLAQGLHANGKVLTADVYGKTVEPGNWDGPQAQDYQALGAVVDEMRIMLYDYNPPVVQSNAPYQWTDDVLAFAKTKMSAAKIMQGLPLYGYDHSAGGGYVGRVWTEIDALVRQYNASITWDGPNHGPWFTYTDAGVNHTVWFENQYSTTDKLDLTNKHGIGGVFFWRLGGEDPGTWTQVRSKL
jgi:spore germination protein